MDKKLFKCSFDIGEFKKALQGISKVILEAKIKITEEGFSLVALDSDYFISLKANRSMFQTYEYEENIDINVNLSSLSNFLRGMDDVVSLETNGDTLKINSLEKKKNIEIRLLAELPEDLEKYERARKMDLPISITIPNETLLDILRDSKNSESGILTFVASENGIKVIIGGLREGYKYEALLSEDRFENKKATYNKMYILDISEGFIGNIVKIDFEKDSPIRLTSQSDNMELVFLLGPIVGDNE